MRVFKSFLSVTVCSTVLSVSTALIGILANDLLTIQLLGTLASA